MCEMRPKGPKSEAQKAESGNWVLGEGHTAHQLLGLSELPSGPGKMWF